MKLFAGTLESGMKRENKTKTPPLRHQTWTLSKALSTLRSNLFIIVGVSVYSWKKGFAEAPARVVEYRKEQQMNNPLLLPLWLVSSSVLEPSQPHFFRCFTPQ